jgi:hypothetical protein
MHMISAQKKKKTIMSDQLCVRFIYDGDQHDRFGFYKSKEVSRWARFLLLNNGVYPYTYMDILYLSKFHGIGN